MGLPYPSPCTPLLARPLCLLSPESKLLVEVVGQDDQAEENVISSVFCALATFTQLMVCTLLLTVECTMHIYQFLVNTALGKCQCAQDIEAHLCKQSILSSHTSSWMLILAQCHWPPKSVASSMISPLSWILGNGILFLSLSAPIIGNYQNFNAGSSMGKLYFNRCPFFPSSSFECSLLYSLLLWHSAALFCFALLPSTLLPYALLLLPLCFNISTTVNTRSRQWLLCPPYHSQPWSGIFCLRGAAFSWQRLTS